ncbi:glycoside hydrolase family 3 N-terminal domain-containing protein [Nocardioides coralli]|uniref:glycoside hydrolase family 3 N-terminal domain-containing protein n=1 Tax=Nocardioides coralli TaxID=2872154 RepID=UPI001CA43520|nr:glycoside hydrolase family 3 N-terminal domain-containing protein [Nocardioides coralli]QZY27887.1 glycosyl hyrolase family 3 [Nocardioides coralli]
MRTTRLLLPVLVLCCALLAGCVGAAEDTGPAPEREGGSAETGAPEEPEATTDPDQPTGWGPTEGELAQAADLVAAWGPQRLAGQVIVGRYHGSDPAEVARMVEDLHLAGVSVTTENVVDEAQVRATTRAVATAHAADGREWPAVIGVDQEGGSVAHLRGIATDFPAFAAAGEAIAADRRSGSRAVADAARTTALELRDLGFSWVFAPVADVTIGAADPTIGSRSPSSEPKLAARAVRAAVAGYNEAGVVSTTKHFPGHGGVTADSHETLPELGSSLRELRRRDLRPFRQAVAAGAPAIMMAHLDVAALAPGVPSSQAPEVYDHLRDELGFEGVAITDSLGMGAALSQDFPAIRALEAGADLLLMPVDTRQTHRLVARAIRTGQVPRERVEEAAARVVALQLWQQRAAAEVAVAPDVAERAREAAAALSAAAW